MLSFYEHFVILATAPAGPRKGSMGLPIVVFLLIPMCFT